MTSKQSSLLNHIKFVFISIASVVLFGCELDEHEPTITIASSEEFPLEERCNKVATEIMLSEAVAIIEHERAPSRKREYFRADNSGHLTYSHRKPPEDLDDNMSHEEFMNYLTHQGWSCRILFDSDNIVTKVEYIYLSND